MPNPPHVVVLGLGIAGSSVAAELAGRGFRVTGIEQFSPLHERGSSHGDTRIFRRVPHEGEVYVQMAARSYDGWRLWSQQAGEALFIECGGIDAGPDSSPMVQAAERLCAQYNQPHTILRGDEFSRKHPHFALPADWRVVYQPRSGIVRPDATRSFLHARAREIGATLLHETVVVGIEHDASEVRVTLLHEPEGRTETLHCDFLVVSAGSWLPSLFPELGLRLSTERRVLAWHEPESTGISSPGKLTDGRMPAFVLDAGGGWYGMPTPDGRIKVGHDKHLQQKIDPSQAPIAPDAEDAAKLAPLIPQYLRGFDPTPAEMKSCIYTLTVDHNFLIDWHPRHGNVLLFSCCSGHGFKFAPVYGELAAEMLTGQPREGMEQFRLARGGSGVTRFSE
jgi:sarcosine oxidase